jgi:hypothetical protein
MPSVLIDERLGSWAPPRGPIDRASAAFRAAIGLPADRPVVMTGHQPVFWHAGILAKYLAAAAIAGRLDAAIAWCVPDMDLVEPGSLRRPVPRSGPGGAGNWAEERLELLSWPGDVARVPIGARTPGRVADEAAGPFGEIANALRAHADAPNAARQVWAAHAELLERRAGLERAVPVVFADDLARTERFRGLVDRMAREADRCVAIYNASVRAFPGSGVRELLHEPERGRVELPLWRVEPGGGRHPVMVSDLAKLSDGALVLPRGLLFSGVLRLWGCDLFIHGTGGAAYDRVTELWLGEWLGAELSPAMTVSATALLELGVPMVTPSDVARASWRAHHARHSPGLLGDDRAEAEKHAIVRAIGEAARGERSRLFGEMHALLGGARSRGAARLERLDREALAMRDAFADRLLAEDRTWPWVLQSDETLGRLRQAIHEGVGVTSGSVGP